jgi:nucleoside-diphosphate-sugar epimerase
VTGGSTGVRPLAVVTGATGFVGGRACAALRARGYTVRAAVRAAGTPPPRDADEVTVTGDLTGEVDWTAAVAGADVVVHLAARAHVMRDRGPDLDAVYAAANVAPTARLAMAAAHAGVRRFVYVSSVKAAAERSLRPLTESDAPAPEDAYGRSKLAAERALAEVAAGTGLEVTVVRPPLVYGAGVRGNFVRLLALARASGRVPVPLGGVSNRRSLVAVENLADALAAVAAHPAAAGETFYVTDGEDLATPELVRRLAAAMGVRARLVAVPAGVLRLTGALAGRGAEVGRLVGSLQVDDARLRSRCGWVAPVSGAEALARTASWYASSGGARRAAAPARA